MTNQEAIKELSEWLDGCCGGEEIEPTRQALRLAISALQVQEAKTQLSAEGTTSVLISRQAAIDRINKQREHLQPDIYPQDKIGDAAYRICAEFIERLPSAQPENEERKEESAQNVPKEDLISRKAAIDAVENIDCSDGVGISALKCEAVGDVVTAIKALPSAQPEPCESDEAAKRLNDLIFDINPAEICAQIEADNLKKWCEIIQVEMKMAMVQLPCWWKDGEVDEAD